MDKAWKIEPQAFAKMLRWLDEDQEAAGQKYEAIRRRLIKVLEYRGCHNAEEITDRVFDIVTRKIDDVIANCTTDPARYFYGVMKNVHSEVTRRTPRFEELSETIAYEEDRIDEDDFQLRYTCLKKCLGKLPEAQRLFILDYYRGEKSEKIKTRRQLAQMIGKTSVRVQAYRLRASLQECVLECIGEENR